MHGEIRERIIRVLLQKPSEQLTKYRIFKEADCSLSWTMDYLKILENMNLLETTKVIDPRSLLMYWSEISKKPETREFFHPNIDSILSKTKLEYALTSYKAENLVNQYLFPSRTDLYINKDDLEKWKKDITSDGLVGKGNVRLLMSDEHVFYEKRKIDKLWVVSQPQLLLDLLKEGGVCREAFEMMVKKHV